MTMDLTRTLSRYFYFIMEDCGDGTFLIPETTLCEGDATYADAKSAIDNAQWKAVRLYRANLALCEIKDVSEETAIALFNEVKDRGEVIEESVFQDFILEHIPASYDVGYRSEPSEDDRVVSMYPDAAE